MQRPDARALLLFKAPPLSTTTSRPLNALLMGEVGERETIAGASPYPKKLTLSEAYPYIMKRATIIITYGALFMKMLKWAPYYY